MIRRYITKVRKDCDGDILALMTSEGHWLSREQVITDLAREAERERRELEYWTRAPDGSTAKICLMVHRGSKDGWVLRTNPDLRGANNLDSLPSVKG